MPTITRAPSPPARSWRLAGAGLLAFALPLSAAAQATAAQPAPEPAKAASEEVVQMGKFEVRAGFAGSLAAAAELKQSSVVVTEVIAAEDIGKLPDTSIADSLTRLTGLATQRTNGRSQQISIRGLNGDFSVGMLNGREQTSTSLNRSVEYDQYPAELINQVVVYKTAAANLTSQGLAGTVDLQTVSPLSKTGRVVALNGYYEWTQLSKLTPGVKAKGNRFSLAYIDQNADGTMGVALGFSHSSKPFEGQQYQSWGFDSPGGNLLIGGMKPYVRTSNLDRDAFMGVLEFKPSEKVHSKIDIYVSDFDEKQMLRGIEIPLAPNWTSWTGNGTVLVAAQSTINDGLYTKAVISNIQPVVRNDVFQRTDKPVAIGWNLQVGEKTAWPVTFDFGYSRVSRKDHNLETWAGVGFRDQPGPVADTMTIQITPGNIPVVTSTLDYSTGSNLKLTDPQGWGPGSLPGGGGYGYLKDFQSKDELGQAKLFTAHKLEGMFNNVEFGLSYTDRYKRDGEIPSGYIHSPSSQVTLPLPPKIGVTDMGFLGFGGVYAFDPLAAYQAGTWGFTQNTDTGITAKRYEIREKVTQLFAQLGIESKMGETPVTGNVGFRVIRTNQSGKGWSANGNNLNRVTDSDIYTQFAPSLNLVFRATSDTYLRLSAARQISRPRMYDMRISRSWGYDATKASNTTIGQSPWSGDGGNTHLRPWVADSLDLSLEHYFKENKGYVSVAGFYKNLRNFIYQQNAVADFSGYPVSSGVPPSLFDGIISTPVNGDGGKIKGLEVTLSLASELLSPSLRGFGMVLGGAYTDSAIKPWGPTGGDQPIGGLSKRVANATLYYERGGFSARVSDHYRSSNRQYVTTFGAPNQGGDVSPNGGFSVAQPENVIDAQISYSIHNERIKDLTFYLQAYNLGNEPLITYDNNDPRQVRNYQKYGASYSVGASYKF